MNRTRNRASLAASTRNAKLPRTYSCFLCLLFSTALMGGCVSQVHQPLPIRDEAVIHVKLVDHIDYVPGAHAYGLSRCANGVCTVEILRQYYPHCVEHEIRHVFEGDWHPGRETLEGC